MYLVRQRRTVVLLLLALLSGCATAGVYNPSVTADYNPSADFSQLKTYDWMPESPHPTGDPVIDENRLLHARLRNAIDRELSERGYTKLPSGTPDFLIGYHVLVEEKTAIRFLNGYYGYSEGWGLSYQERTGRSYQSEGPMEKVELDYEQGTLVLDMALPEPRDLIWRGVGTAVLKQDVDSDTRQERINLTVKKLLDQFPPPQEPAAE